MESSTDSEGGGGGTATSVDSAAMINYMLSKMLESGNMHLVISQLIPILEQLDFVIEVEGDYKSGGGFEPHIKIRVSRNASKFSDHGLASSSQRINDILSTAAMNTITNTASNSSNTFTWNDVSSSDNNGKEEKQV